MTLRNVKRLSKLARTGTKSSHILDTPSLAHEPDSTPRFKGTDENNPIARSTFDQDIEHPMHTVIKIDVGRARLISPNELACTRAGKGVAGFVAFHEICFHLNHRAGAFSPYKFRSDQSFRALQRIALKKGLGQHARKIAESISTEVTLLCLRPMAPSQSRNGQT
jgi:hypothetical protein